MSLCEACALSGKTCCQQTDVLLTVGDLLRIREHRGQDDFWEWRPPRDLNCVGEEEDPHWRAYTVKPDGKRRVLRHIGAEDCFFLAPRGCTLPLDVRPLICRLHPVSYTENGITGTATACPTHLLAEGGELLAAVGVDLEAARNWHVQLYVELRGENADQSRAA